MKKDSICTFFMFILKYYSIFHSLSSFYWDGKFCHLLLKNQYKLISFRHTQVLWRVFIISHLITSSLAFPSQTTLNFSAHLLLLCIYSFNDFTDAETEGKLNKFPKITQLVNRTPNTCQLLLVLGIW